MHKGHLFRLHFREKPALTFLPALCWAICAGPHEVVPEILFQPIGLSFSPSTQSCAAISSSASLWTSQSRPMRTVTFRSIKLWGFGCLIRMRMNKSCTRSKDSDCVSQPSSGSESVLSLSTEDWRLHLPSWSSNTNNETANMSHWSRAKCTSTGQSRAA